MTSFSLKQGIWWTSVLVHETYKLDYPIYKGTPIGGWSMLAFIVRHAAAFMSLYIYTCMDITVFVYIPTELGLKPAHA